VRATVLKAAAELLFDGGAATVTFDKVAARAGSSKMTLYKWWPSPGVLALEAYFDSPEHRLSFPDTGDIEADLLTQMTAFVRLLNDQGGKVIAGLIGAAQSDPALARALREFYSGPRRQLAIDRLRHAQQAGQLRSGLDLAAIVDQLWGACYHRMLLFGELPDPAAARTLITNLLHGIAAPLCSASSSDCQKITERSRVCHRTTSSDAA
jgi:AcrR family transcriptional regulator